MQNLRNSTNKESDDAYDISVALHSLACATPHNIEPWSSICRGHGNVHGTLTWLSVEHSFQLLLGLRLSLVWYFGPGSPLAN